MKNNVNKSYFQNILTIQEETALISTKLIMLPVL